MTKRPSEQQSPAGSIGLPVRVHREKAAPVAAARSGTGQVRLNVRASTLMAAVLALAASWLAWLGFSGAFTIEVPVVAVSLYLVGSAICFAVLGFITIRQPQGWLRAIGILALAAMLFTLVMAVVFYQALSGISLPEY